MKNRWMFIGLLSLMPIAVIAQELSGSELLNKAIAYHDPDSNWSSFAGELQLLFTGPAMEDRQSHITIDLPNEYFNVSTVQNGATSFREIKGQQCRFSGENGEVIQTSTSDDACERTRMYRDYYTYLYGLPMKLKDPGTIVDPKVERVLFKGKSYLRLKVSYSEEVGSDIWYFYFDPTTYAMEVYQFFKPDEPQSGEYILLTDQVVIQSIVMPKDRAWYYNKDDGFLGTDILQNE